MAWFGRRGALAEIPLLRPRGQERPARRVEFTDLHPDTSTYLGQACYLQLSIYETITGVVAELTSLEDKRVVASAAGFALTKHQAIAAEIRRRGEDAAQLMEPSRDAVERFRTVTRGNSLAETLLSITITAGLLDDLYVGLSASLPSDIGPRIGALLGGETGREAITGILQREIAADPTLGSFLAMWGRRLVGDTLLLAHAALPLGSGAHESRIEPVFTELIAAHTRRMDALGLTA